MSLHRLILAVCRWDWPFIVAAALVVRALEAEEQALFDLWERWEGQPS